MLKNIGHSWEARYSNSVLNYTNVLIYENTINHNHCQLTLLLLTYFVHQLVEFSTNRIGQPDPPPYIKPYVWHIWVPVLSWHTWHLLHLFLPSSTFSSYLCQRLLFTFSNQKPPFHLSLVYLPFGFLTYLLYVFQDWKHRVVPNNFLCNSYSIFIFPWP